MNTLITILLIFGVGILTYLGCKYADERGRWL